MCICASVLLLAGEAGISLLKQRLQYCLRSPKLAEMSTQGWQICYRRPRILWNDSRKLGRIFKVPKLY